MSTQTAQAASATLTGPELLERLNWRYATKKFAPEQKVSAEDWASLEEVLHLSPSSGGLQPWGFVVVDDPAVREQLVAAAFNQPQVRDASHLVVFAAKTQVDEAFVDAHINQTVRVRGLAPADLAAFRGMLVGGIVNSMDAPTRTAWAARQAYIALGTLLTSAAVLGIDACPMEGFLPAQFDEILGLKEKGLTAVVICTFGYRAQDDANAALPKVRFPREQVISHV